MLAQIKMLMPIIGVLGYVVLGGRAAEVEQTITVGGGMQMETMRRMRISDQELLTIIMVLHDHDQE
jgi:hypothetical protein